jgi:16S rRNA (adenine1518-N6/adenine1519-N6)-dimethyltransferase
MAAFDDLPPLRDVIREHDLAARRSLGQNFLLDLNLTAKIARAAGPLAGHTLVEIGPGPGGLTRALLAAGAEHVVAIERDPRCVAALGAVVARYPGRLTVIEGDALTADITTLADGRPLRIVANLPYNIGTPLLIGWLKTKPWPGPIASMTLMFQREVAERIVAGPERPKDYGRLGVICGWRTTARILFDLPPAAFTPPPKVTSSVIELVPRPDDGATSLAALETVTAHAFGQRRKMLRQSLKGLGVAAEELLAAAGLPATGRAEEVPVEGFVRLAAAYDRLRRSGLIGRDDGGEIVLQLLDQPADGRAPHAPQPLGSQDSAQLRKTAIKIVIDDHIVIIVPVAQLGLGGAQTADDGGIVVFGAPLQAAAHLVDRRRQHEDAHDILGHGGGKLPGALHVDVEQHVLALRQRLHHRIARRAVEIAMHLGPFEQLAAIAHEGEFRHALEEIMRAVDLTLPARPRRHRHGHGDVLLAFEEVAAERGLAGPRGRGNHQKHTTADGLSITLACHGTHSTF